jgi:hypothetical protein
MDMLPVQIVLISLEVFLFLVLGLNLLLIMINRLIPARLRFAVDALSWCMQIGCIVLVAVSLWLVIDVHVYLARFQQVPSQFPGVLLVVAGTTAATVKLGTSLAPKLYSRKQSDEPS